MYESILIAADGSELSEKAARQGLELAKAIGAATTVVHVTSPWSSIAVGEIAVMFPPQDYEANMVAAAAVLFERIRHLAGEIGVATCKTVHVSDLHPHSAILTTARENGCDLIVMGSHGRRGIAGLLLGGVTAKTLSHSNIPVLVHRE